MIQIFVNNYECVIPDDFSFALIEENPLITAKGEFSLDMTLSLLEAKNAIAFKFLNRINKYFAPDFSKDAPACLIVDGSARYGKIVVFSNTDISVTYQFIAGNSALNYDLRKDNRKIWELNWGVIEAPILYEDALFSIGFNRYGYYNIVPRPVYINFVCAPIYSNDGTNKIIINDYTLGAQTDPDPYAINGGSHFIAQPYLMYYINKIAEVLGYNMGINVLESDDRALKIYLVNAIDSLIYADMLPDVTMAKFIEAIEDFFNVVFVIDKVTNTLSIQNMIANIAIRNKVDILNVIDAYERNLSATPKTERIGKTKISYPLDSSFYAKFQKVDVDLMKLCQVIEHVNFAAIVSFLSLSEGMGDKLIIHRDVETLRDYFVRNYRDGKDPKTEMYQKLISWSAGGNSGQIEIVHINKFRSYGESFESELSLEFVPAAMTTDIRNLTNIREGGTTVNKDFIYQLPVSSRNYFKYVGMGFIESVLDTEKKIPRLSNFEIALYTGKINLCGTFSVGVYSHTADFPFSHVDTLPDFDAENQENWVANAYAPAVTTTLRLLGSNGVIEDYNFESIMDTSTEYTFTLVDSPDVNINNFFNINNKTFMPISLERIISNRKDKTVIGKFYAMLS